MISPSISFSASTLLCLLLAMALLSSRALRPQCARLLGLNYVLFALQGALGVMVFTGFWPEAGLVRAVSAMLLGPALYAYFVSALRPLVQPNYRQLWHLAPALLMVAVLWRREWALVDPLIIASFSGYWLTVLWQLKQSPPDGAPARAWLWILVALMPINIAVEIATALEIRRGVDVADTDALGIGGVVFAGFHSVTLLLTLARAPLIEWMHELKLPNTSPTLSVEEQQQLLNRWQTLVESKALYRIEPAITLPRAARLLGVPARQLSQVINGLYGASFSQYLNDVRVAKAKALLHAERGMSITDVFLEAGFSSKSHFHREFTRVVGITPSAYRKQATP